MAPIARPALALLGGIAVVGMLIWFGGKARDDLNKRGHYSLKLDQLDVPTPPGMNRGDFLAEVRYESNLPELIDRSEPNVAARIQAAFAAHPWVESANVGDLSKANAVQLTFRTPALIVGGRVIDRLGVVLPLRTPTQGLAEFRGAVSEVGITGRPCGDPAIAAVAKTMGWLNAQLPDVQWLSATLSKTDGLTLTRRDGTQVIWGLGTAAEPSADEKLTKLRSASDAKIDLRIR